MNFDVTAARPEAEYRDKHVSAEVAARDGYVDEVILPDDTRGRLAWALKTIGGGVRRANGRGNIPL